MMNINILAIIVTYNGEKYIEDCIDSLSRQTRKIDILLLDNDSSDNTCSIVYDKYPETVIIQMGYNSGFAHANNVGIKYAIDKGYSYVLLINEDTVSDEHLLDALLRYADSNTAVIPKIYGNKALTKLWYAAGKMDFEKGIAINCCKELADQVTEISFMTGCCMFLHTDIFRKIGFFDEAYFMYYEDTDFSLRMYENKIRMLYVPDTYVWHRIQGRRESGYHEYYMERNRLFFLKKHAEIFRCSLIKLIFSELQQIFLEPNARIVTFTKYMIRGIVDFIRNKTGMMEE